jgi:hypothetical protein
MVTRSPFPASSEARRAGIAPRSIREIAEAVRDLRAGEQVIVLTWLDRPGATS